MRQSRKEYRNTQVVFSKHGGYKKMISLNTNLYCYLFSVNQNSYRSPFHVLPNCKNVQLPSFPAPRMHPKPQRKWQNLLHSSLAEALKRIEKIHKVLTLLKTEILSNKHQQLSSSSFFLFLYDFHLFCQLFGLMGGHR